MSTEPLEDRHALARRRALRAARAVTLGIFAMGGCATTVSESGTYPAARADGSAADVPGDAPLADAGAADVATDVVAVCGRDGGNEAWTRCCQAIGWDWNRGCEAWGPFVPPEMEA